MTKIHGTIHPSSQPTFDPPGYYLCIRLDPQQPWPAALKNGGRVTVEVHDAPSPNFRAMSLEEIRAYPTLEDPTHGK